jgi:hypothetical protein
MNINRPFKFSIVLGIILVGVAWLKAQTREEPNVSFPAPAKREQQAAKSLSGQVVDAQKAGVAQAVVHLKNKKTAEVRTRIAGADGRFVIRGLDRDTDYEVHAEFQGSSSDNKAVSSFDDRDEVQVTLELK